MIVGINSVEDKVKILANKFGLTVGSWRLNYLGLLSDNPRTLKFLGLVVEKIEKRLGGWKRAHLCKGYENGNGSHLRKRDKAARPKT